MYLEDQAPERPVINVLVMRSSRQHFGTKFIRIKPKSRTLPQIVESPAESIAS